MSRFVLQTGQTVCYDEDGNSVPCGGTGQDAEFVAGIPWPRPRFKARGAGVLDQLTGLLWSRNANPAQFPLTWREALDFVMEMNRDSRFGFSDWRLPNRRELRSLMGHQSRKPALPAGHPFENVFLGWYWTSTTAAIHPAYAWYVHMEGARMFYGRKDQYCLLWPVRGGNAAVLPRTGQDACFDGAGREIGCAGTGQDGAARFGGIWPEPRFQEQEATVLDLLTGLRWLKKANLGAAPVNWLEALRAVRRLNGNGFSGFKTWRLPNINELESLVDCSRHDPALPKGHLFENVQEVYWSSSTSFFEPDWAWALYMHKGAVGVGFKKGKGFAVWPVCEAGI